MGDRYLPCVLSAVSNSDIENGRFRVTVESLSYHAMKRSFRLKRSGNGRRFRIRIRLFNWRTYALFMQFSLVVSDYYDKV